MADFDLSFLAKPVALLPITKHKRSLQYAVETYPVVVIVGETGSGKTTQLPQYLDEAGWTSDGKMIAVTQPRRVAATNIANRVAAEMRCQIGEDVGYSIRFEEAVSAKTRIKFLTDGMLLREALLDPLLSKYSVIMIDEAHERSLSSDILLGLLKKIQKQRPELKIIVSSATIEADKIAQFFEDDNLENDNPSCKIVALPGRSYPVDVHYLEKAAEDYVTTAVETAITIHKEEAQGDILIFLTGRDEIQKALELLTDYSRTILPSQQALQPMPLYAGLDQSSQMYIFSPAAENTRKVILSTNVAEASVTIEGIVYVVDCGFVKLRSYNPLTNIETLTRVPVSQASATQRAGRAGRTKAGKCYRLYTSPVFQSLPRTTSPEIQRTNLAPTILQVKALGIDNVAQFPYLTPPPAKLMARGLETLYSLGALDEYAKLTKPLGTRMAELAVPPMLAKALLASTTPHFNCVNEVLTIAAMCSLQSAGNTGGIWFDYEGQRKAMELSRRKFAAEEGDHLTYLNVFQAFVGQGKRDQRWCQQHYLNHKALSRAVSIRAQLRRYLERFGYRIPDLDTGSAQQKQHETASTDVTTRILRCLTSGYFMNVARMNPMDGTFRPLSASKQNSITMHAHPTSLMFNRKAEYVLFHELLETGEKVYIKDISKIEKSWITELGGSYYQVKERRG
ncbi:hypothetical protein PMZ80_005695 [Knufia obscura]|uniref:RNA helicase n=1 Tax=Knufia obscura TaxID=1635080 RepID=A0ABR0RMB6_9EURO|nr:hypothetical protein PMZ80_005695 [Knufia obscura]